MKRKRIFLWVVAAAATLLTWLPNFGIMNSLIWVGPFPLPMAWILGLNIVLTGCVFMTYPLCFKPLCDKLEKEPIETIKETKKA